MTRDKRLEGGCFCGSVRYQLEGRLDKARCCHCSRCRKAFSGASSAYAELTPASTLRWIRGESSLSIYETAPGWAMAFCAVCGTTLCGLLHGQVHGLTLGSVDGDPGVDIAMHIYVASKAPWDHIGGDAPQYPELPPGWTLDEA